MARVICIKSQPFSVSNTWKCYFFDGTVPEIIESLKIEPGNPIHIFDVPSIVRSTCPKLYVRCMIIWANLPNLDWQ
jgi:hypothetical protein